MQSKLYQDRIDLQPDEIKWYQFSFNRVFLAICITLLVLLAYMANDIQPAAIQAVAGLSGY